MRTLLIASLLMVAGSGAWACTSNEIATGVDANGKTICVEANVGNAPSGGNPVGQTGGAVTGGSPVKQSSPFPGKGCMATLASYASDQLKANLVSDKAVTQSVIDSIGSTTISEAELGVKCASVCQAFDELTAKITSAKLGPPTGPGTPAYMYKSMQYPSMPGQAEMHACIPAGLTKNWCPKSGSGVGAGPSRIENPLDKIKVCISGGDALANMNFSDADIARGCARPNIVDAAVRIKAEHQCVTDTAQFDAKMKQAAIDKAAADAAAKAAADKAAANGNAQLPSGNIGMTPGARKKP